MSQRLPRRVGVSAAKQMMMTGRTVEAVEAHRLGLIDLLAPEGHLDDLVARFVADVLANSWHTNFATKRLMRETDALSLAQGLAYERDRHPGFAPDYKERINRFGRN
jgi:enoyl-CoA hydratase